MTAVWIREATIEDARLALERSAFAKHEGSLPAVVGYMTMSDKSYVGLADGQIVCIWGVLRHSLLSDRGYLWLVVTEKAEEHKFLLIRYSQRIIESLFKSFRVLTGECLVGDWRARKWMTLLGATFGPVEGKTIPFQIEGKQWIR